MVTIIPQATNAVYWNTELTELSLATDKIKLSANYLDESLTNNTSTLSTSEPFMSAERLCFCPVKSKPI